MGSSLSGALARLAGISPLSPIIISLSIEISFAVIFFFLFSDCTHTHNALVKKQKKRLQSSLSLFQLSRVRLNTEKEKLGVCVYVCAHEMMVMLLSSPTTAPGGGKSGSKAKDFFKNVSTKKKLQNFVGDPEAIERRRRHFHLVNYEFLSVFSFST